MNINKQLAELKSFDLPADEFVIVSSGALAIRGIREAKDLDLITTPSLWDQLVKHYPVSRNEFGVERIALNEGIEILNSNQSIFGNGKTIPLQQIFDQADLFEGLKFINLKHLKVIKQKLGREIDIGDVELIDAYWSHSAAS